MKKYLIAGLILSSWSCFSEQIPLRYTELLDYVQPSPDQGDTVSCLFVGSTGVMELIANKKAGIKNPLPYGPFDLSESFLMHAPAAFEEDKVLFIEGKVLRFNIGYGIHINDWPFEAWEDAEPTRTVWQSREWSQMTKVPLPKVMTVPLFTFGNRWSTNVLKPVHIQQVKEALVKYRSPVLINYNDSNYWHVISIVGYDDTLPGNCYQITAKECDESTGSFYVRDSFGVGVEVRDYDWFRVNVNTAIVVKEK